MKGYALLMVLVTLFFFSPFYVGKSVRDAFLLPPSAESSNGLPMANFTYSQKDVTVNMLVQFFDNSSGTIAYWYWEFGDGITMNITMSQEANRSHAYAVTGVYTVSLTVGDGQGNLSIVETLISVRKIITTLALSMPASTAQGSEVLLTAILKDELGSSLQAQQILFYSIEGQKESLVGSGSTDPLGRANIKYTPQVSGLVEFRAVFIGTDVYAGTSSGVEALEVGFDILPYAVLFSVGILIMSVVLAYIRGKRRKEEKEEELAVLEEEEK
jgi:hypothetical protein